MVVSFISREMYSFLSLSPQCYWIPSETVAAYTAERSVGIPRPEETEYVHAEAYSSDWNL